MQDMAEFGVAVAADAIDTADDQVKGPERDKWLRSMLEWQQDASD